MDPNLVPAFALQINVAEGINPWLGGPMSPPVGAGALCSGKKVGRSRRLSARYPKQDRHLIYYQLDRIFIVRAPVNPLLVVQTSESLEDCGANFRRRLYVLRSIAPGVP